MRHATRKEREMALNEAAIRHLAWGLIEKVPKENWNFATMAWTRPRCEKNENGTVQNDLGLAVRRLSTLQENCGAIGCAIGHALAFFPQLNASSVDEELKELLGIGATDYRSLFGFERGLARAIYPGKFFDDISSQDVGNALLRYLDEGPWWEQ